MNFWETLLCAFLASLLALILGGLHTIGAFRKRRPKEPPLDKGFIPWIGHGIQFRKSPLELLQRMRKKHGAIFTVLVGGNYINFVLDPHTYEPLMKESQEKLDFDTFASMIIHKVFDFQPTQAHHRVVKKLSKKYLNGKYLTVLNQILMEKLQLVMLNRQDSDEAQRSWQQEGLFHFSYKTIFQAGFLTLFGTEAEKERESKGNSVQSQLALSAELCECFKTFDHFFPQLVVGLLKPAEEKEARQLEGIFWENLSIEKVYQRDNISSWILEQDQQMAKDGMPEKMRTQFLLLLLWLSQANTGPTAFWILAHLLKYPEAMKAVKEEVDRIIKETFQEVKPGSPFLSLSLDTIKTPLLDSAIEETLRLKANSFLFRSVMKDTDVKMGDGREYTLRKGDSLFLFPFIALHMDPEVYPNPHSFKYDRFINPDGTRKKFFRNGKQLKNHLLPFGAGTMVCPGRYFAVSEMRMFVILMLIYFDMELVNADEDIPPMDEERCGFGNAKPSHDIQFRYRLRCQE